MPNIWKHRLAASVFLPSSCCWCFLSAVNFVCVVCDFLDDDDDDDDDDLVAVLCLFVVLLAVCVCAPTCMLAVTQTL